MTNHDSKSAGEAERLEQLWAGEFGGQYIERNQNAPNGRDAFWNQFLKTYHVKNVLEVGCNIGGNLRWIAGILPPTSVYGIDINAQAVEFLKKKVPGLQLSVCGAKKLPFKDASFDLVFTAGVLIHQPEETLPQVMEEIVRVSRKYVLCLEYESASTVEVPYRDQTGALFKRPYGQLYQKQFPSLSLVKSGYLSPEEGWDRVTYHLFEKSRA